jgi:hypothetical protein
VFARYSGGGSRLGCRGLGSVSMGGGKLGSGTKIRTGDSFGCPVLESDAFVG